MLLSNLDLLATAPGGVARLRELILTLAVQGKLVPQDPTDEPASVLLQKIRAEKDRLIAEGKIKRDKPLEAMVEEDSPFEAPAGWEWVKFGVIAGIERGGSPRPIQSFLTDDPDGLNWIKIGDTDKGGKYITSTREKIRREGLTKTRMVFPGDFLLTNSMSFGRPYITKIEGCIHDGWLRISPTSSLKKNYLFSLISSQFIRNLFVAAAAGGVVLNLNADKVRNVPIPLPPLAEQSRIVARVEELMRLCDALEAKVQLETTQHAQLANTLLGRLTVSTTSEELADNWQRVSQHFDLLLDRPEAIDALEQTLLQLAVRGLLVHQDASDEPASTLLARIRFEKDLLIAEGKIKRDKPLPPITEEEQPFELPVGWEWARLGEIMLISSGVTLGRKTAIPSPVALPYLRVANVQRWHLNLSSMKEVVIDQSELERFQLLSGDLLITEGGDWDKVGRTAIWRDELKFCLHQNHVFKARGISPDWNSVWAELYLNSGVARAYFASSAKQTTNLASINMTQLKDCAFPVPPIAEQSRIVTRVTALRQLCADLRQRLKAAQATQSHLAQALVESSNTL